MSVNRRSLFHRLVAGASGVVAAAAIRPARAAEGAPLKVVYHLADFDKVAFVLGNIRHHLDGAGGPDKVTIALVVHGAALRAFHAGSANLEMSTRVSEAVLNGVSLHACSHTMKGQNVTLAGLLQGFAIAEKGGVVLIAQLQAQGYAYIRP